MLDFMSLVDICYLGKLYHHHVGILFHLFESYKVALWPVSSQIGFWCAQSGEQSFMGSKVNIDRTSSVPTGPAL